MSKPAEGQGHPCDLAKLEKGEALRLLRDASNVLRQKGKCLRFRLPGVVEINGECFDEICVLGDLHGDFFTLKRLLKLAGLPREGCLLVFLGDYVDRGPRQLETLLCPMLLKAENPESVIMLRGNHEPPAWLLPYPHDFPSRLASLFGPAEIPELLREFYMFFERLPLVAIIPREAVFLHGGPPIRAMSASTLEEALSIGDPAFDDADVEAILWSDPTEGDYLAASYRGAGFLYGRSFSERVLKVLEVKRIIRGHEAVEGFKLDHGKKVVTIFDAPVPYGFESAGMLRAVRRDGEFYFAAEKIDIYRSRVVERAVV